MQKQTIAIGRVLGAHGVRGELKVEPLTDDPGRFYDLDEVIIDDGRMKALYPIELVRIHKGKVLLTLEGITDRNQSEKLRGAMLEINREDAVDLEENEYFIEDLIGMAVHDVNSGLLGHVKNVIQTSGTVDTIEIELADTSRCIYVPARQIYFPKVDIPSGIVTADIPEDLMHL